MTVDAAVTDLRLDALKDKAERQAGFADYGDTEFEHRLGVLLDDVRAARPNSLMSKAVESYVVGNLHNRLCVVEDRKQRPDIAKQQINAPLVVMGLPRSGTTFLHSLLAQDPRSGSPLQWEVSRPSPPPEAATYTTDGRIALSQAEMPKDPEFLSMHIQDAQLPVECGSLLGYDFANYIGTFARWDVPNYLALWRVPGDSSYLWHRKILQHLQSRNPRDYWVLKYPCHVLGIRELIATYPDVRIVFTHRAPSTIIPSVSSLVAYFRRVSGAAVDLPKIGRDQADVWDEGLRRCLDFRAGLGNSKRFFDVAYSELTAQPLAVVDRIYEHFGFSLSPSRRGVISKWFNDYSLDKYQGRHGRHRYTAEDYGLKPAELDERFSYYARQFAF